MDDVWIERMDKDNGWHEKERWKDCVDGKKEGRKEGMDGKARHVDRSIIDRVAYEERNVNMKMETRMKEGR